MKLENVTTCEDCLSLLTGVEIPKQTSKSYQDFGFQLASTDATILISIAKQLAKKIPLTDRQYELVKKKLLEDYRTQFDNYGVDLDSVIENLKFPLREVDRSHWLKIVKWNNENILGIRFPFNKKIIDRVEELRVLNKRGDVKYDKHIHYFNITPSNIVSLVEIADRFPHKFEIDIEIKEAYDTFKEYEKNKQDYIPGIFDNVLRNLPDSAVQKLREELGPLTDETYPLYYDRRYIYGLHHFENTVQKCNNLSTLSKKIVNRDNACIIIHKEEFSLDLLISSIVELQRLPILIVLDPKTAYDDLVTLHNSLKHIIPSRDISVLFRKDGPDLFNTYVSENGINNPVDTNTQIVYINNTKLPKPLLQSKFKHRSVLELHKSLTYNNVIAYTQSCDLQIVYDDETGIGYWNRRQRTYIK